MHPAVKVTHPAPYQDQLASSGPALYEIGREMLADTVATGKEFCKFMLSLSIAAVPIYVGLLILALPYDSDKGWIKGAALLIPGCIFLISALIFAIAYFPGQVNFSPISAYDLERTRIQILRRRSRWVKVGFLCFVLGTLLGMVAIIKAHL